MTIQDWGAIGEVVGAAGVVITLAYLATQIRHQNLATRARMVQDAATAQQRLIMRLMDDDMVAVTRKRQAGEPLDPAESQKQEMWTHANLRGYESYFYQQRLGFFDEDIHRAKLVLLRRQMSTEQGRELWKRNRDMYEHRFAAFMDGVVAAAEAEAGRDAAGSASS